MTTISPSEVAEAARQYWRGVLEAGGFTAIPRWARGVAPGVGSAPGIGIAAGVGTAAGVASHEATVPGDLTAVLRQRGAELGVPLSSVLLAAHARVIGALSGEPDIVTGYLATSRGRPLPCRLAADASSWRALLRDTHRCEGELLSHQDFPVDELCRELGLAGPSFETVFDPAGDDGKLTGDVVLRVGISPDRNRLVLRLKYRTDAMDAGCAARIAGYYLTALALIAADLEAEPGRQSLLSAGELRFQLEGLAGPHRELPDRRAHELFEHRVKAHPEAVAAVQGDRRWTYAELNARANRLARALQARGLRREGVVAVVTERTLDWVAAILAVFKAGGVYLPIEPHFPADRIGAMLSRAGCELVLTEPGSTAALSQALDSRPGIQMLLTGAADEENHADGDLGVAVTPDQLAYIYFTSGSTGEPKGAMCEHAGLVNHLYAKIDDLEIGEGRVVAQIAPQCFDISLWQIMSALLAGGQVLLVEQEAILDVSRFLDTVIRGRAAVLQIVPSYLEVVLTALERRPRELPDLRYVSVTGEALKKELIQRWFSAKPGIKLVNAYGLTETSDDTNHEVMDRPPDGDRVPLGRPISNVRVYVVDEHLAPVPLGAPGVIAFAGVCVGRGYINDPERTAVAYRADPYYQGQRLYLGGDYGRWQPDGKLEFLGRRDTQVKISGFRIEIGEIENALLQVPGVRDGAVVVAGQPGQARRLVAFYSGPRPLEADALRNRLASSLPGYMIPSAFRWRESLPLTANSKIDVKTLTALASLPALAPVPALGSLPALAALAAGPDDDARPDYRAPVTPTERRLAAAWATVLGIPPDQIGRHDNFFELGGTSLSAVKVAITLDRAVSLKDLTHHPVLADLAGLVDGRSERPSGLLQSLLEPDAGQDAALVCFPYAGGNAVNFQSMARALRGSGLAVYAAELPGHDLAAENEPFVPMAQVVEQACAEITRLQVPRVLLWGHSSGAAFAVATAAKLGEAGVDVQRVFVAAQLPGDAADRRASITDLTGRSDADIAAELTTVTGAADFPAEPSEADFRAELGQLDAPRAEQIGAAYRHDCVSAHCWIADALDRPAAVKLSAPVTVVVAADDPYTAGSRHRYREWQLVADQVDLHELADGGHYFLRTRPAQAAQAVLRADGWSASS
jgi:amino acid adenylation domain-containing protein